MLIEVEESFDTFVEIQLKDCGFTVGTGLSGVNKLNNYE
jgi:hypothetical protein